MRAAHNLRALAENFAVHLLVVAMYGGHEGTPDDAILRLCVTWKRIDASIPPRTPQRWSLRKWIRWGNGFLPAEWSGWNLENGREADAYFEETRCIRLWVFRFYLLPWAKAWLDRGGKAWLDLDEAESGARKSQAELYGATGKPAESRKLEADARIYRNLESRFLPRFERIVTASKMETARLRTMDTSLRVETWPNIVPPAPAHERPSTATRGGLRLLFVGSLGHFPNREAIHYAVREVLPRLQTLAGGEVVLAVAGAGADAHRAEFTGLDHIDWLGTPPDLTGAYAGADVVLVPLHAGGGTRIKILEAFAHRKPVVSTHFGAEGLDVAHDRELLLADDPDQMASHCAELFLNTAKRARLVAAAYDFVRSRHSMEVLKPLAAALAQQIADERSSAV